MKNSITTILFFLTVIMNGQTITNSSFKSECLENGFNNSYNCIQGWYATHGKPHIKGNVGENTWGWMWSHSNYGAGIATNYNFEAGNTYQISFKIRTTSNISNPNSIVLNATANVRATSAIDSTNNTYEMITIPSSSEQIWSKPIKNTLNNWKIINVTFAPLNDNRQLWFYPLMTQLANANDGGQIQMEIDDVEVILLTNKKNNIAKNKLTKKESTLSNSKKLAYKK